MPTLCIVLKDITESGGGERVCVNLANALHALGYKIHIISLFSKQSQPVFNLHEDIIITKTSSLSPSTKNPFEKLFCKSLYRTYLHHKVDRILSDIKPDSVLANDGWYIPQRKIPNTCYLRLWHLRAPKKFTKRKIKIFQRFDTLILLSKRELHTWQHYHKNIKVIPNFLPDIPKHYSDSKPHIILSVGRLTHEKGFLRLIEIWNLAQQKLLKDNIKSDWQLHIIGDGVMKEEIESAIQQKSMQDSIVLKPFTKEIDVLYKNASIYAMSSVFEGFPMVLLEACAQGLCPISFDIDTGPSDIIESHVNGYLIADNDLEGFADALLSLMADSLKRKTMGVKAREFVALKFSKEAIMPLWQEIL